MDKNSDKTPLQVVLITNTFGFPNGMAATQRAKLICMSLVQNNVDALVVCCGMDDSYTQSANKSTQGQINGVRFVYTTGTTSRPKRFLQRRWIEIKGMVGVLWLLRKLKLQKKVDLIYLFGASSQFMIVNMAILFTAKLLNIPVVGEINERPWSALDNPSWLEQHISPIAHLKGVVTISDYLSEWVANENRRRKVKVVHLQIPILVNTEEFKPLLPTQIKPAFLFAGSPGYDQTLQFILDAMKFVWQKVPECKLIVTGCDKDHKEGASYRKLFGDSSVSERVELTGYLSRQELLNQYACSSALLIPLFDDVRSTARFPTKIGEYLSSGRPLITNSVGEVNKYLMDGETAYVCPPGDPRQYGEKMIDVLQHPDQAVKIGINGRKLAESCFDYSQYGAQFASFFLSIAKSQNG